MTYILQSFCDQFHQNPTIDPYTGRTIQIGDDTYRRLVAICSEPPGM